MGSIRIGCATFPIGRSAGLSKMGLYGHFLKLIALDHKREPFEGPALFLGRQRCELMPFAYCQDIIRESGIEPKELPADFNIGPNIPAVSTLNETSDEALLRLLGVDEVHAMDYSNFEGADIIHDLNLPVEESLRERFGLIIDGGTLEHVFDLRRAFQNVAEMLKPGGRVIHFGAPANNCFEHGFVQFSPTFFQDFYEANGFTDIRISIMIMANEETPERMKLPLPLITYTRESFGGSCSIFSDLSHQVNLFVTATKTAESTSDKIPIQGRYRLRYEEEQQGRIPYQFPIYNVHFDRTKGAELTRVV